MGFNAPVGNGGATATSGTSFNVTYVTHGTGNLICFGVFGFQGLTLGSVKDNLGNTANITAASPSNVNDATAGSVWLAWILVPATVGTTWTTTFSAGTITTASIDIIEYSATSTIFFDTSIAGNSTGTGGSVINTPTINPAASGELLYAFGSPSSTISGVGGSWVISPNGVNSTDGTCSEYILSSASGGTAVDFTVLSPPDTWDAMAMAFTLTSGSPLTKTLADNANNDNW